MYIPIGVLIVLFLINPNLALDLIFIGVALYFWPVTLAIIAIIAIVYGITLLLAEISNAPEIDDICKFFQSEKYKAFITDIKTNYQKYSEILFKLFLETIVVLCIIIAFLMVIAAIIYLIK